MVGITLGHYRIERLLGSGGMSDVYQAEDTKLGRPIALKVLSQALVDDPERRERFEREARAAAALNHPNIVTIHSVEEVDGLTFLTLELIEGQTLAEIIPAGGLSLDRLLDLGIALADGVGAAHQRGITHRDLKPANVMLTSDGRLKILDFGLAKIKEDVRVADTAMPTALLTGEGRILGTVAYMSPEQAEAKPVDQRSDVFSLGVILYEMATGVRPFQGDTQMSTLSAIIKDTPKSLADVRPSLPRDVAKIVNRCLAKDPEDRYQTAKDLRNDLRALKSDLASGELQAVNRSEERVRVSWLWERRRNLIAAAVLAATAVLALALWSKSSGRSDSSPRPFDSTRLARVTTTGSVGSAAISPDGRYVAYVSVNDTKWGLSLRQIATTSNVELIPPDDVPKGAPTFGPDGSYIYYVAYGPGSTVATLYRIPVLGGGATRILEGIDSSVAFSPDGRQLAFLRRDAKAGSDALVLASVDGANQRELATRKRPQLYVLNGVSWSADGKSIAVVAGNEQDSRRQIVLADVSTGTETIVPTPEWRTVGRAAWLPDGTGILVNAQEDSGETSTQIFLVRYPSGTTRRVTSDLSSYSGLSVAADGRSFVAIRSDRRVTLWTTALGNPTAAVAITSQAAGDDGSEGVAWTPDGRLVYVSGASGNPDIWIMSADGSRRVQLTSSPGYDVSPQVTNDGRYIVFASDRDGAMRGWRMGVDGSGAMRLTSDVVARSRVYPSADGKWVYYDTTKNEARRVSIDGGQPEAVFSSDLLARVGGTLPKRFHEPMPSPDGSAVAGHYVAERGEGIAVIPMQNGAVKLFDTVPPNGTWSPDGKALLYIETRDGVSNVMRQPVTGGPPSPVTHFTADQIFGYAASPDRKHLAIVRGRVASDVVLVSEVR